MCWRPEIEKSKVMWGSLFFLSLSFSIFFQLLLIWNEPKNKTGMSADLPLQWDVGVHVGGAWGRRSRGAVGGGVGCCVSCHPPLWGRRLRDDLQHSPAPIKDKHNHLTSGNVAFSVFQLKYEVIVLLLNFPASILQTPITFTFKHVLYIFETKHFFFK